MPATIGFLGMLKVPFGLIYQLGPTQGSRNMRSMGLVSPKTIYDSLAKDAADRNTFVKNYKAYRKRMNEYSPYLPKGEGRTPVDKDEWDLYLAPDTSFDKQAAAALEAGWTIDFVSRKSSKRELKRLEAKRGKGYVSITIWSRVGGVADGLGE